MIFPFYLLIRVNKKIYTTYIQANEGPIAPPFPGGCQVRATSIITIFIGGLYRLPLLAHPHQKVVKAAQRATEAQDMKHELRDVRLESLGEDRGDGGKGLA
jgi:hypothetical protein